MVFKENYLHEIPEDIQKLILEYTFHKYYDIYVTVSTNSNLKNRKQYVSKRMHKKIMNLEYSHKNVSTYTSVFYDRYMNAFFSLKEHIRNVISTLKDEHIRDIFIFNNIWDAKQVYNIMYGDRKNIKDYDRELLLEFVLNMYKTNIYLNFIS